VAPVGVMKELLRLWAQNSWLVCRKLVSKVTVALQQRLNGAC
jgi:hypothetical protein